MKETRSLLKRLVVCGVALAMVSTLAAQTVNQDTVKVIRIKGAARYATGSNAGQLLKVGDLVKPGSVIQTADNSRCDFLLGGGSAPAAQTAPSSMSSYTPAVEQNVVRMWENTLLGIDKLSVTKIGADEVTDTQLDLKAGHIFGTVKKMSAASRYEVKLPFGVAGIRGTVYDISAEGIVKVLSGTVVLAYTKPDGTVKTPRIGELQEFDYPTEELKPLPPADKKGMEVDRQQLAMGVPSQPQRPIDKTVDFISPTSTR